MRPGNTWLIRLSLLAAACVLAGTGFYLNSHFYHDDAYITLRYCRNLIEGHGLVWNEGERVEGYTNFLHLQAIALLGRLGVDLVSASRIVSAVSFTGLVGLLLGYWRSARSRGESDLAALPLLFTITSFPLIVWTLGGLEAPLFALLATLGIVAFLRASNGSGSAAPLAISGLSFALAAMTRPEGLGLFLLSAIVLTVTVSIRPGPRGRTAAIMVFCGSFLALYVPYFLWRTSYYGDLLPNTFYVKGTGGGPERWLGGGRYVAGYLLAPPFTGLFLAGALLALLVRRTMGRGIAYLLVVLGGYMAWVVSVGGDHMTAYRFMVPVVPAIGLLLHRLLERSAKAKRHGVAVAACAAVVVLGFLQPAFHSLNPRKADPAAYKGGIVGRYIASHWAAGSLVALNTAGSTPFEAADLLFLDMLGLNDRHIAHREIDLTETDWQRVPGHAKGDGAYVLARRPDYIIVGPAEGTTIDDPWFLSDLEISRLREDLDRDYTLETADIDVRDLPDHELFQATAGGSLHFVYYRRTGGPARGEEQ